MALSEKSRNEMYRYFSATQLGEEVTSEMIASFPGDDFVTKDFLRAELADQIGSVRTDMAEQIGTLRTDMANQIGTLRTDMANQIGTLRTDMANQIGSVRTDMAEQTQKLLLWMVATMITLAGILSGLIIAVR